MKFRGGYNVVLGGRPASAVEVPREPDALYLPLRSRRFTFGDLRVAEGERVHPGQVLAKDPDNFSVPLLAPREGTVRLRSADGHIVLEDIVKAPEEPYHPAEGEPHIPKEMGSAGMKRYKLLSLGAWQFFGDAHTGAMPDPFSVPRAILVSTVQLEPFLARGDVQLYKRLRSFTRGLEHLQSLLEYQPMYLVLPRVESALASRVRETLRGYAWLKAVPIARRYGHDNSTVLARLLGLKRQQEHPVWAVNTAGVLAVDRALTLSRPSTVRIVSLGGPAVQEPCHLKVMPGYPLRPMLDARLSAGPHRVINGGVLTGGAVGAEQLGLDVECEGLTVLHEQSEREFLGFTRPGFDRRSYSNCFASFFRRAFAEPLTTGLRGERRACINCNFCEEVCPAAIMPHLIHKYLYHDALEEADRARVDLCVHCGLCSFVCPSKLELGKQFIEAQETIRQELRGGEEAAA